MPGQFTFEALKNQVADGTIDTVLACFVDMQGRLMGKRLCRQFCGNLFRRNALL